MRLDSTAFRRSWQADLAILRFLGYLSDIAGTRTKEVSLLERRPLREILPDAFPEQNVIVLIDRKAGNLDSLIGNESSVLLMPIVSGG
jgi:hypothetical protein